MRASVTSSAIIHAVVIGWGLLSFSSPTPMDMANSESMPIDIVSDISQLQKGDKKAPKAEKPTPKPTQKPQTVPDAQNVGDSETDVETKPTPETKPKPVEAAEAPKPSETPVAKPEPQPEPKPVVQPEPKPIPVPATEVKTDPAPKEEVKPDPVAEAINEVKSDPAPKEEAKPTPTPPVDKPAEEAFKLPDTVAKPEAKPTPPAQTAKTPDRKEVQEKPKPTQTASTPSKDKDGIADQVAELLNKQKPSAGGAKRSSDQASLGANKATGGSKLSQSEMDALRGLIEGNWNKPVGAEETPEMMIVVKFRLTKDGEIDGRPEVSGSGGDSGLLDAVKSSALRAVMKSAPFNLPQDKYDTWSSVELTFHPGAT
ncbi:outer membrane biosynthesis protein TonB [Phyllobacterium trifolii]|jgi:outer membrane biosynthesis protein TonB|uniref:Outer membrane biosynthesis protein TonB n=1 Tax=Phyllobacterium trifolii TaxID=300193 RepID=A0A839UBS4_9HYPH|nr:cell envelope integrity protein TolA [Phyllobacterium trifolii]MBB3147374.1 outer membrane biosynthesis protein TonB [Phyllobacterium trifolii]